MGSFGFAEETASRRDSIGASFWKNCSKPLYVGKASSQIAFSSLHRLSRDKTVSID
ncbi:hypothetical protein DPMN_069971 [Dreissena polymorpha]|uniref:Uncharacterized protein n=1 Tax=Dreissena polymorpha TaxID=45954 RepID=A0A9D3Z561_DREPO|nr:hypothetical protein DPMN_069971 [Dreissena polymorpha]